MQAKHDYKPLFTLNLHNRSLQLTREGGGFIALLFAVGIGAINTGNNLLYLIMAMCCSFIAVSGFLSELAIKQISVEGMIHKTLYAEKPYPLTLRLTNHKRKIPSYSLLLNFQPSPNGKMENSVYFFHIPCGCSIENQTTFTAYKRGPVHITQCRLSTSFPFGFFVKSKPITLDIHSIVFPRIRPVKLPTPTDSSEEGEGIIKSRGEEIYSLREFRPGDALGAVHWKSTAKTGALKIKQFSRGGNKSYTIFLNIIDPQTNKTVSQHILEKRISEAASLAYHLIRQGDEVSLKTHDHHISPGNTETKLEEILSYLALVK